MYVWFCLQPQLPHVSGVTNEDQRSFHYKAACSITTAATRNWLLFSGSPISEEHCCSAHFAWALCSQRGSGAVFPRASLAVSALTSSFLTHEVQVWSCFLVWSKMELAFLFSFCLLLQGDFGDEKEHRCPYSTRLKQKSPRFIFQTRFFINWKGNVCSLRTCRKVKQMKGKIADNFANQWWLLLTF